MAVAAPTTLMNNVEAVRHTLYEALKNDERTLVLGEDVGARGNVFLITKGFLEEFGPERVLDTPLAEASIVGVAIGMAMEGLRPIAEIQFADFIYPAFNQIVGEAAKTRYRSNGDYTCPLVIRTPYGGGVRGALSHSVSIEALFYHVPGLKIVAPSFPADIKGLLNAAIDDPDPVLFLEHKKLYREMYNRAPYPGPDFMIPFGKAKVVKTGTSLTVITYGAIVQKALLAAQDVEKRSPGVSIEVIDLRTLSPYDWDAIRTSVEKTSRVMVAHEDTLSFGYGAEIVARIADELFTSLDAPVKRVAALDTWVGYHPQLEAKILPQTDDLVRTIDQLLAW